SALHRGRSHPLSEHHAPHSWRAGVQAGTTPAFGAWHFEDGARPAAAPSRRSAEPDGGFGQRHSGTHYAASAISTVRGETSTARGGSSCCGSPSFSVRC